MLDLNLTNLYQENGHEHREPAGLRAGLASQTPRIRGADRLILQLSQTSSMPGSAYNAMPPNLVRELLSRVNATYATLTGPVNDGLQRMADELNTFMVNRNLRQGRQQDAQAIGLLNMAVLHGNTLHLAQVGPVHAFLIQKGKVEHFRENGPLRGLGIKRDLTVRFIERELVADALLVLSSYLPEEWSETTLLGSNGLDGEPLRRLLTEGRGDLEAVAVRFVNPPARHIPAAGQRSAVRQGPVPTGRAPFPSAGTSLPLQPSVRAQSALESLLAGRGAQPAPAMHLAQTDTDTLPRPGGGQTQEVAVPVRPPWVEAPPAPPRREVTFAMPGGANIRAAQREAELREAEERFRPLPETPAPPPVAEPRRDTNRRRRSAPGVWQPRGTLPDRSSRIESNRRERVRARASVPGAGAAFSARVARGALGGLGLVFHWLGSQLGRLAGRLVPARHTENGQITRGMMLAIATVIPLLIVSLATAVYLFQGRGVVADEALRTAQDFADKAFVASDNAARRENLTQAMEWLSRSKEYGAAGVPEELRNRIQDGLDRLDGITRVEFRPALEGNLGEGTRIRRIIPVGTDLYLLNETQGNVLRLTRSGQGYELDKTFVCAPGEFGGGLMEVGALVDITPLPPKNFVHATIMGIDDQGRVLLCQPGEVPSAQRLQSPDVGWQKLTRAIQLQNTLYVLDTQANQVYRYEYSSTEQNFVGKPGLYFDLQVPRLGDVVDLAADQQNLYLMHQDGSMTSCNTAGASTLCDDPAPYRETREGHPADPLRFPEADFVTLISTQPPDPSLYILDAQGPAVYNFSHRRLNLQRVYRPEDESAFMRAGTRPDAFAVTGNRRLVATVGGQVFIAALP